MKFDGVFIIIFLFLKDTFSTELQDNTQETITCISYYANKNTKSDSIEQEADNNEEIPERNSFLCLGRVTAFINDGLNVENDEIEQFLNYPIIKTLKILKGRSSEFNSAIDRTTMLNLLEKSIDLIDPLLKSLKIKEDKNLAVFQDHIEKICIKFQDLNKLFNEVEELYEEKENNQGTLDFLSIIRNIIFLKEKISDLNIEFECCKDFKHKICLIDHIKKIQFFSEYQSNIMDIRTMIGNINNDEFKHKSTLLKIGFLNTTSLVYDILLEVLCRENETIKCQYKTLDNIFVKMEKYFENLESLKETLIKN